MEGPRVQRDVGEKVEDLAEDRYRLGIIADQGRSAGWDTIMAVPVKEFEPAFSAGKGKSLVDAVSPFVPGFATIEPCHVKRDPALPQVPFQVT